jgi:proteasome lid subunit RPN8/RPN11
VRELEQQRKGRNKNTIIDYNYISSNRYRKKFDYISNDKKLNKLLYKIAKKMLLHRSGTEYEDMYWIDLINGKIVCKITDSKYKKKILYTTTIKKMIKKSENLLTIHTHPDSFPPSIDDINSNYDHNYEIGIVICHDGRVYMYSAEERINVNYYKLTVEDYLKNGYNEDTAQIEALKEMQKKFSIYFKEVTEDDCV